MFIVLSPERTRHLRIVGSVGDQALGRHRALWVVVILFLSGMLTKWMENQLMDIPL